MEFFKEFLKNLLWNCGSDFEIISQDCSFGDLFQKFIGPGGGGFVGLEEIL